MRSIEYPYTLYKRTYLPVIPVQLQHLGNWYRKWAFVDSGATYSIFAAVEAASMGLDLSHATQRHVVVGDGGFIPASFVKMPTRIGEVELQIEIGFSERLGIGFNLLGRKDVFERFRVCFSDKERVVSFHLDESNK